MKSFATGLIVAGLAVCASGCQFYSVHGQETPKGYLTHNWAYYEKKGNSRFTDMKTGKEVRLTATERERVPFDEALAEVAAANTIRPPSAISQVRIDQARRPVTVGAR